MPPAASSDQLRYAVCGAVAGGVSRSFTAPIERVKVLMQVQAGGEYRGLWASLRRIHAEEGWRGGFKGNGTNVLRVAPSAAVRFSSFELFKRKLLERRARGAALVHARGPMGGLASASGPRLGAAENVAAGCGAGLVSTVATYPLDMLRSRLAAQTGAEARYRGLGHAVRVVMREEGALAFYRGVMTSVHGAVPYVGINFACYEFLKARVLDRYYAPGTSRPPKAVSLACGGLAGSAAMTVTYPFELVRRRMMVQGMAAAPAEAPYAGTLDAFRRIWTREGARGLFRGLWPNYFKVVPSMSIGFMTYETCKGWMRLA